MMKYPFESKISNRILDFVDYKISLGYRCEESCRVLWKLDRFCCEKFPEKAILDREWVLPGWKCVIQREMPDIETVSWF